MRNRSLTGLLLSLLLFACGNADTERGGTLFSYGLTLHATAGNTTVTLTWNEIPDAVSYVASYRKSDSQDVVRKSVYTNNIEIGGLQNGTRYSFTVAAVDSERMEIVRSATVEATPMIDAGQVGNSGNPAEQR